MKILLIKNWLKIIACCCLIIICNNKTTFATETAKLNVPFFEHKHEIGINASQLLSNLLSLNVNNTPNTPFGLHYAYHQKKVTIRLGVNAMYKKQRDFLNIGGDRELLDHSFGARLGIERSFTILPRLNMHAGIDGIVQNVHEESIIIGQFFTSINTVTFGGGPALRMIYKINKSINISTECTAYGTIGYKVQRVQLGAPRPELKKATDAGFSLTMPTSLFISILF
jgi:hypothetical protein